MYSLPDSIAWASAFVQFQPLTAGLNAEPALSIGNMIRDSIMYVGVWPWNRNETTQAITAGTQDYTIALTDFGFLEKATLTDASDETYELQDVLNQAPLAAGDTAPGRPVSISIIDFNPGVSIKIRLLGMPQEAFTLTLTYQKLVLEFTYDVVTQVIPSSPTGGALDDHGEGSSSSLVSVFDVPAAPLTTLVNNEWAIANFEAPISTVDGSWTEISTTQMYQKMITSAGSDAQFSGTFSSGSTYCGCIATFFTTGGAPDFSNFWETGFTFTTLPRSFTSVLTNPMENGSTIIIGIVLLGPTGGVTTVTDANGNTYTLLQNSTATSRQAQLWIATNEGATGVNQVTVSNTMGFASSGGVMVMEVRGLSSGPTQYIGTFDPSDYPTGTEVLISGFTNKTNNGLFSILTSDSTHLFVDNTEAIAESVTNGTAVIGDWYPIPENYKDIYNNLFLSEVFALVDDERSRMYRTRGMAALMGRAGGLSETEKNIFTQRQIAQTKSKASFQALATRSVAGRGQ